VHIHATVVVEHVETDGDHDVEVGRLEDEEVLVLVLEHELVDERVFLEAFESFRQFLHVEMAAAVGKDLKRSVSVWLVVTEDVVSQGEVWI